MISDKLLAELKQILLEDYKIQLADKELKLFANNYKGFVLELVKAVQGKEKVLKLFINKSKNENSQAK